MLYTRSYDLLTVKLLSYFSSSSSLFPPLIFVLLHCSHLSDFPYTTSASLVSMQMSYVNYLWSPQYEWEIGAFEHDLQWRSPECPSSRKSLTSLFPSRIHVFFQPYYFSTFDLQGFRWFRWCRQHQHKFPLDYGNSAIFSRNVQNYTEIKFQKARLNFVGVGWGGWAILPPIGNRVKKSLQYPSTPIYVEYMIQRFMDSKCIFNYDHYAKIRTVNVSIVTWMKLFKTFILNLCNLTTPLKEKLVDGNYI